MAGDPFDGKTRDKSSLKPEENAQFRHMKDEISKVWPELSAIAMLSKSAKILAGILGTALMLGGAVAWAVGQGWFG